MVTRLTLRGSTSGEEKWANDLVGNGFTAAARSASGEARIVRKFDPTANETLFYPRLVGG